MGGTEAIDGLVYSDTERQFPRLPAPIGLKRTYWARVIPGAPRTSIVAGSVTFHEKRFKPGKDGEPMQEIPNLVELADNQVEALKKFVREVRIPVYIRDEEAGVTRRATAPVSNWVRLERYEDEPAREIHWDTPEDHDLVVEPVEDIVANDVPTEVVETVREPEEDHRCQICGWTPAADSRNPVRSMGQHMRNKHPKVDESDG